MGEQNVSHGSDEREKRAFTKAILDDLQALELMLEGGMFETGIRRIGAEQEMFLVDDGCRPVGSALAVMASMDDPSFTTELALFNLEANLPPAEFGGRCLRDLENQLQSAFDKAREHARRCGSQALLTGILPTLQLSDLGLDNMTPNPRYFALNDAMVRMRGGEFQTRIKGIDELYATHDNVMLESCNTSFQIHFQVAPEEFADLYNLAQAVTAPVLAAAANSPLLLGRRLWHETRIALFQQSVDARSALHAARGQRPRVSFGDRWLDDSVLEIFREDIARFRVVLTTDPGEHPIESLERGVMPKLSALCLHNGTVYRWNRACYGVHENVAHLRIENRILPAGPTVLDEVANAAFFFGLMAGMDEFTGRVRESLAFDDAKANFVAAARHGLKAQFTWLDGREYTAQSLITENLLPLARAGLAQRGVESSDIDRYLGVLEERVRRQRTGSSWMLASLAEMPAETPRDVKLRALTASIIANQEHGEPVHTWPLASLEHTKDWRPSYQRVEQFMTTELFTLQPGDLVDLAASLMDWERIRHIPVEDSDGRLVGIVSHRTLIRMLARAHGKTVDPVPVDDVMKTDLVTCTPDTTTVEAVRLMRGQKIGCLPVVKDGRLIGIVTERDFLDVAAKLIDEHFEEAPTA